MVLHSVVGIVFVLSVGMVSGMDINGKGRVRNLYVVQEQGSGWLYCM